MGVAALCMESGVGRCGKRGGIGGVHAGAHGPSRLRRAHRVQRGVPLTAGSVPQSTHVGGDRAFTRVEGTCGKQAHAGSCFHEDGVGMGIKESKEPGNSGKSLGFRSVPSL